MEYKQIRSCNFQKKETYDSQLRQKAINKILVSQIDNKKEKQLIEDYIEANENYRYLEKEAQLKLKKDKIDPFCDQALDDYKGHLRILKHGWNRSSLDRRNSQIKLKQKYAKKIDFDF